MATSGALNGFLDAMLRLRSQRLAEQEAKLEQSNKIAAMGMAAGNQIGDSILGAIQQSGANRAANSIMNQQASIPRAQAVNPSLQAGADAAAARMPGFYTGGVDELRFRNAMQSAQGSQVGRLIQSMRLGLARRADQRAEDRFRESRANAAFARKTDEADKIYRDSMAYMEAAPNILEKIKKAQTLDEYNFLANQARSLNEMAAGRKLTVSPITIPPFVSPDDRALLEELSQAEQEEAASGMLGRARNRILGGPVLDAQQSIQGKFSPMSSRPGQGVNTESGRRVGSIAINPTTGEKLMWNGSTFIPIK